MLYTFAYLATNAINPILVVLLLQEPLLSRGTRREQWLHTLRFFGYALLSMGIAVLLAEAGKKYEVWHGHPGFPSGHTTLATSTATCIVLQRGNKWAFLAVPLVLLMSVCLVYGHWHTPIEVFAGWILGIAIPALFWPGTWQKRALTPSLRDTPLPNLGEGTGGEDE